MIIKNNKFIDELNLTACSRSFTQASSPCFLLTLRHSHVRRSRLYETYGCHQWLGFALHFSRGNVSLLYSSFRCYLPIANKQPALCMPACLFPILFFFLLYHPHVLISFCSPLFTLCQKGMCF